MSQPQPSIDRSYTLNTLLARRLPGTILDLVRTSRRRAPQEICLPELVGAQALASPQALALKAGAESLTYGELDEKANQLAHYLQALGVGPESIVGLCLERSLDFVISALGILKAGAAYLPLDPAYPRERLAFMLGDAEPQVLVTRRQIARTIPAGGWRVLSLDRDASQIDRYPTAAPYNRARPDNLAYVIYTSGSTGEPKGVEITHSSLMNLVSWHQNSFSVTAADKASLLASVGFDAAVWETWPYLAAGASLNLPAEDKRLSPELLRDWLTAEEITISFLPTVLAEQVIALEWPADTALRYLLTGADTLHRFPPTDLPFQLINNYGPTECTVVATSGTVAPAVGRDTFIPVPTIGRPIAATEIYILDENLREVAAGTTGELYIGGAGVARGYLNRPELTASRFIHDPFRGLQGKPGQERLYKTGDLARYLPNGEIAYGGRIDDQIKIMGYRIEPNEIVASLNRHLSIQASVVAAHGESCSEKHLVAYVVLHAAAQATAAELRGFLQLELPDYMVPSIFVQLDSLPVTPNGKVDTKALPAPDADNTLWDEGFLAPRTPLEERLAAMLSSLLGLEAVSVNDNFFILGGHSLLGTQLIGQIRTTFGVDLALRSLFDAPTIAELAFEVEALLRARVEAMTEEEAQLLLV